MKGWFQSHKWWTTVALLLAWLFVALYGFSWWRSLKQRREMATVQEYIQRLQPQITSDSRFQRSPHAWIQWGRSLEALYPYDWHRQIGGGLGLFGELHRQFKTADSNFDS